MTAARWLACLWPGLPQLWRHGHWQAWGLAAAFGLLLNLVLLSTVVWTEIVSPSVAAVAWGSLAVFWLISVVLSLRWRPATLSPTQDLFPAALSEYLKGNWYEVERLCRQRLAERRGDVETQLLLATMLRHTQRLGEAREQLDRLALIEAAEPWSWEIRSELERLNDAEQAGAPPVAKIEAA